MDILLFFLQIVLSTFLHIVGVNAQNSSSYNSSSSAPNGYIAKAYYSTNVLNNLYYDVPSGLWQKFWWNSANCLQVNADLAAIYPPYLAAATPFFANTLQKAPLSARYPNFRNEFYDDEAWWALAWIKAYDVTQDSIYLNTACSIFTDLLTGWNATCGGHWWDKKHTQNGAIANELFLSVAAHLAARVPSDRAYYLDWATREWSWFQQSGLINAAGSVNDGLDLRSCRNNAGPVWSYNQGVILGGLVELDAVAPDPALLTAANAIARAAIHNLTESNNGILTDPGAQNPDPTVAQFKGVFLRNLQRLNEVAPSDDYAAFITRNADSIWQRDRGADGSLGPRWQGPMYPANAASQSSAIDCLIAAAAVKS